MGRAGRVHLAGPAYCPEEREAALSLAAFLEKSGFDVYLRARDGIESFLPAGEVAGDSRLRSALDGAAFALEVFQVASACDCLVFNMNGRVPDDGGAFLAGVAFGCGRPVVLYKRDHRTELAGRDNAMIPGLSFDFRSVSQRSKLPGEISRAIARVSGSRVEEASLSGFVRANVELGRAVWQALQDHGGGQTGDSDALAARLVSLFEESDLSGQRA